MDAAPRCCLSLEMRRDSKFTVLALVGVAVLVGLAAVIMSGTATGPVRLTLQSYTNATAVITIKNQGSLPFDYYAVMAERKIGGRWPEGLVPGTIINKNQTGSLGAGQQINLTIPVMVYAPPQPWRISVFCWRNQPIAAFNSSRFKCILWLNKLHMSRLSQKLVEPKMVQVSSPQMEQYEK